MDTKDNRCTIILVRQFAGDDQAAKSAVNEAMSTILHSKIGAKKLVDYNLSSEDADKMGAVLMDKMNEFYAAMNAGKAAGRTQ